MRKNLSLLRIYDFIAFNKIFIKSLFYIDIFF
jgi:hypothetical protein